MVAINFLFFFCITCLTLEELFDDLREITSSLNSTLNDLDALKRESITNYLK